MPVCQPARRKGRLLGEGLTSEKMQECRWLKTALVGEFEFVDWTPDPVSYWRNLKAAYRDALGLSDEMNAFASRKLD